MKLVTYEEAGGQPKPGILSEDGTQVVPVTGYGSVQEIIEGGAAARRRLDVLDRTSSIPLASVRLLAPLPRPVQIRDVLCFLQHMRNAGKIAVTFQGQDPESYVIPPSFETAPRYYKANRMCVVGPEHDVAWPEGCNMLDYELELGIIIGKKGKNITRENARDHIFGYTIFNDVSARDLQVDEMAAGLGPAKGKDFDTGNVFGPCIITADAIDIDNLAMTARLNGEVVSQGNSSQMDHKVEDVIAHVSRNETIYPGEILGSGTVPLGCLMEHGRSLSPNDVVELEVDGIGILRNKVVKAT